MLAIQYFHHLFMALGNRDKARPTPRINGSVMTTHSARAFCRRTMTSSRTLASLCEKAGVSLSNMSCGDTVCSMSMMSRMCALSRTLSLESPAAGTDSVSGET